MPIEIRELVIKASLTEDAKEGDDINLALKEDLAELKQQIMEDIKDFVISESQRIQKDILETSEERTRELMNQLIR